MKKIAYAVTVLTFFGLIGALYVYDRLNGIKIRKRLVTYREYDDDEA